MKGMIFSADSVRAIQRGDKTQTRRVCKEGANCDSAMKSAIGEEWKFGVHMGNCGTMSIGLAKSKWIKPPYTPGETVYVKETWCPIRWCVNGQIESRAIYRADTPTTGSEDRWRSPLHLPERYARLWLRIDDVRVERLQEISEADAQAEGIDAEHAEGIGYVVPSPHGYIRATEAFRELWNAVNHKRAPWESNPWVWRIAFTSAPAPEPAPAARGATTEGLAE